MARGTEFITLLSMLRAECGHSSSVAAGTDNEFALKQKLQRTQQMLYDQYDWPFLRETWSIDLQAGQRYYNWPFNLAADNATADYLNAERVEAAAINYSGRPVKLDRGISFEQYAQYNSDNDERASPARRWDMKSTQGGGGGLSEQIEIWPIPTDNTQIFQLRGIRALRPLIQAGDTADIDDLLIVLTTAGEILARSGAKDAKAVQSAATARLRQMTSRIKGASRQITMVGSPDYTRNMGKTIIRIGSQSTS